MSILTRVKASTNDRVPVRNRPTATHKIPTNDLTRTTCIAYIYIKNQATQINQKAVLLGLNNKPSGRTQLQQTHARKVII